MSLFDLALKEPFVTVLFELEFALITDSVSNSPSPTYLILHYRIVLADNKVHILGSYQNIQIAKRAICNLILGSPPSKVYGTLRSVAARAKESF